MIIHIQETPTTNSQWQIPNKTFKQCKQRQLYSKCKGTRSRRKSRSKVSFWLSSNEARVETNFTLIKLIFYWIISFGTTCILEGFFNSLQIKLKISHNPKFPLIKFHGPQKIQKKLISLNRLRYPLNHNSWSDGISQQTFTCVK